MTPSRAMNVSSCSCLPNSKLGCVLWVDSASYATWRLTSGGSVNKPLNLQPTFSESVRGYTWLSNRTPPSLAGNKPLARFFLFFPRPPTFQMCVFFFVVTSRLQHRVTRMSQSGRSNKCQDPYLERTTFQEPSEDCPSSQKLEPYPKESHSEQSPEQTPRRTSPLTWKHSPPASVCLWGPRRKRMHTG